MVNARLIAVEILDKVYNDNGYSNILLKDRLNRSDLTNVDKSLVTELVYGTIQRQISLDYIINMFLLRGNIKELSSWLQQTLRSAVYQIVFLEKIPAHAAVNESVEVAKHNGSKKQAAMVNAVLRNVLRNIDKINIDNLEIDKIDKLSIKYGIPQWLIKKWLTELSYLDIEDFHNMLALMNRTPLTTIRMNTLKINNEQFEAALNNCDIYWQKSPNINNLYYLKAAGNIYNSYIYKEGFFSVQDESSAMVAKLINPKSSALILDTCAAPGGKSMHLAELQNDKGIIIANEIHPHKAKHILEQADRLGINSVRINISDIMMYKTKQKFDYVLLDAPCSGLGVLRRKPEIRFRITQKDIESLVSLQAKILAHVTQFVKVGGFLIYSTCTISEHENSRQIANFLCNYTNFSKVDINDLIPDKLKVANLKLGELQILPHYINSDGFYIAKLQKMMEE